MCWGMSRWKAVSKYAIEVACFKFEMFALMTERAAPLCLQQTK